MMCLSKRKQLSTLGSCTKVPTSLLGPGYWYGFRKRYKDKLISHQGVQFGHDHSKWCNFETFERMYNLVYEAMELAGVVKKLPVAQWQNKRGECVRREQFVGEKVEYETSHPIYIIYADEVGIICVRKMMGARVDRSF